MLSVLHNNRDKLDAMVDGRVDPKLRMHRLPVRVHGHDLSDDAEPRVQNDSTGYALWFTSRLIKDGAITPSTRHLDVLAQAIRYLDVIKYWHDADEGHWEEDQRVQASSIGVVIAGIREAQAMFQQHHYTHDIEIDELIEKGEGALYSILQRGLTDRVAPGDTQRRESFPETVHPDKLVRKHFEQFSVSQRRYDAALLFLIEPLDVLKPAWARKIVTDIERHLQRDHGISRYQGDTYWEPRFPAIMSIEERTRSAEGRTEKRNTTAAGVAYSGTEAQWTLFDPLLSVYWGKRYQTTGDHADREKQLSHLDRSLAQLVRIADGRLLLPEAYYYEFTQKQGNQWIPEDHMPLLWSQANLLLALKLFETT